MFYEFFNKEDHQNLPNKRNETERIGVRLVEKIISEKFNWIFIENNLQNDYGIDAFIEIVEVNKVTGRLIALQIKTGESYFDEEKEDGFKFYGDNKHLSYWLNHSLPVILVLCNPITNMCYWGRITKDSISKTSKSWYTVVNKDKILDESSRSEFYKIADRSDYQKRLDSLLVAKPWMDEIINGNQIILESEEWINKISGRGSLKILVNDQRTNDNSIKEEFSNIYFPMYDYKELFPLLFPWADINVDEEYYNFFEEDDFFVDHSYKDYDTKEWLPSPNYDEDYYLFKSNLPKIRPYIIEAGEVAKYRLILEINDFGKSFYNVDSYLRNENKMLFLLKDINSGIECINSQNQLEEDTVQKKLTDTLSDFKNINYNMVDGNNKLGSLIPQLINDFQANYEYIQCELTSSSTPLIDYMENELIELYNILNREFCFTNFMIDQFACLSSTNSIEKVNEVKKIKLLLIEALKKVFDCRNRIKENFYKREIIKKGLEDKYTEHNEKFYNDLSNEALNNYINIEKNCEGLQLLEEEWHQIYEAEKKLEESLKYLLFVFLNEYNELAKPFVSNVEDL